jgi:predicted aldo/keto reductase-like oxidoreductase
MFSINPAMDMVYSNYTIEDFFEKVDGLKENNAEKRRLDIDQNRAALYNLCEKKRVGITVMKTLGGGRLLAAESSPFKIPMSVSQCIHYALSRPAVSSVLIGAKSVEEMDQALVYLDASEKEKDYSSIFENIDEHQENSCLYCSHCLPCPAEINIAAVTKILDKAKVAGATEELKSKYAALSTKASACLSCGVCEGRCPFGVGIIKNMQAAVQMFE